MINNRNRAVLALGGNKGDVLSTFKKAVDMIAMECGVVTGLSSVYETEAWGYSNQPAFLNRVLVIETALDPEELYRVISGIEVRLGKSKEFENGPRTVDIDILFYNDLIINTPTLTIPHPRMHLRRFNVIPLLDILPEFVHPVLRKTMNEIANKIDDGLEIRKLNTEEPSNES